MAHDRSQRHRRGHTDAHLLPDGSTRRVASYQHWGAQVVLAVLPIARLLFGIQNLFDAEPPFSNLGLGYDPVDADSRGRRFTVGLRAAWS